MGEADAHCGDADAAAVENVEKLPEPRAPRTQQVGLGDSATLEREGARVGGVPSHLPVGAALGVAGSAGGDDDVRDLVAVRARGDRHAARDLRASVGDELLGAVDHPFAVGELGPGARGAGVGSPLGLGEAEGGQPASAAELRHPL